MKPQQFLPRNRLSRNVRRPDASKASVCETHWSSGTLRRIEGAESHSRATADFHAPGEVLKSSEVCLRNVQNRLKKVPSIGGAAYFPK